MKLLEEKIGGNLGDLGFGDDLLNATPKVWPMNKKIDKLDFIFKNFVLWQTM